MKRWRAASYSARLGAISSRSASSSRVLRSAKREYRALSLEPAHSTRSRRGERRGSPSRSISSSSFLARRWRLSDDSAAASLASIPNPRQSQAEPPIGQIPQGERSSNPGYGREWRDCWEYLVEHGDKLPPYAPKR